MGLASHRGSLEGTWRTARASCVELTRRKPKENLLEESLRRGWKKGIEGFGVASKPLRSSSAAEAAAASVHGHFRNEVMSRKSS